MGTALRGQVRPGPGGVPDLCPTAERPKFCPRHSAWQNVLSTPWNRRTDDLPGWRAAHRRRRRRPELAGLVEEVLTRWDDATSLYREMALSEDLSDFLTLPAHERMP